MGNRCTHRRGELDTLEKLGPLWRRWLTSLDGSGLVATPTLHRVHLIGIWSAPWNCNALDPCLEGEGGLAEACLPRVRARSYGDVEIPRLAHPWVLRVWSSWCFLLLTCLFTPLYPYQDKPVAFGKTVITI
ncbi:hypothetical protein BDW74DRAFT_91108 [Aspergillus multicolor]|uniref:uncharacterized protein n=1 Tax=Aspergillus multicolor TaxID=41759 RepID=UPI003CCE2586